MINIATVITQKHILKIAHSLESNCTNKVMYSNFKWAIWCPRSTLLMHRASKTSGFKLSLRTCWCQHVHYQPHFSVKKPVRTGITIKVAVAIPLGLNTSLHLFSSWWKLGTSQRSSEVFFAHVCVQKNVMVGWPDGHCVGWQSGQWRH